MKQPATRPAKPLREQAQEAVNAQTVKIVKDGFEAIDQIAARGKRELAKKGITGADDLLESGADLLKRILIRGISK